MNDIIEILEWSIEHRGPGIFEKTINNSSFLLLIDHQNSRILRRVYHLL